MSGMSDRIKLPTWMNLILGVLILIYSVRIVGMTRYSQQTESIPAVSSESSTAKSVTEFTGALFQRDTSAPESTGMRPDTRSWISTRFGLELKGTAGDQMAIVRDLASNQEKLLKKGDSYKNATVTSIERNRLVLESAGIREELILPADSSIMETHPAVSITTPAPTTLHRKELAAILRDVAQLSEEISLQPVRGADGGTSGYKVTSLKPQGFLAKIGLRKTDLITAINSQKILSPEDVYRVLEEASHQDRLTLNLRRNQSDVQMEFTLD